MNRLLVAASLCAVLGGFLAIADRMTKAGLSSHIEIGAAIAAALTTGIVFQVNYRRAVRLIDRIFLPRRYAAAVALDRIRASLRERQATSPSHVAADVADAVGVISVAVFARAQDGGFVRRVAFGWQGGTAWHLLPGEALTASLDAGRRVVLLPRDAEADAEMSLPQARARPLVAITLRRRGRVESAIMLGPDPSGATPDLDTVRGLAAILGELLVA